MALVTSLNTAAQALLAYQSALQTVGHNIANSTTPGFSRQRVEFITREPHDFQRFQIGRGVAIGRVRRLVDEAIEERLRDARSSLGSLTARSSAATRLELTFQALTDSDLGASLAKFFDSMEDLSLNPAHTPTRVQVIQQGQVLADRMRSLADEMRLQRDRLNDEINLEVGEINRITGEMAELNRQVLLAENGGINIDGANDLRDRRERLLQDLNERIAARGVETSTGQLNVLVGSSFVVFGNTAEALDVEDSVDLNSTVSNVTFEGGDGILQINGGQLRGLLDARDGTVRDALRDLNILANTMLRELNTIHASGQGLERFDSITSEHGVNDSTEPLAFFGGVTSDTTLRTRIIDSSKINFTGTLIGREVLITSGANALERRTITDFDPATGTMFVDEPFLTAMQTGDDYQITDLPTEIQNGTFEFRVTNEVTGNVTTATINVNVLNDPLIADTLASVAAQISAVDPSVTATVLPDGRLRITSADDDLRFSFAEDSSKLLAGLGLGQFFSGDSAFNIGVNGNLATNSKLLASATTNDPGDGGNALAMLQLRDQAVVLGEATLEGFYQSLVGGIGVEVQDAGDRLEHASLAAQQLDNQRQRVSGVNIDEEATNLLVFQRAFQASARFLVVVDDLLETLINTI